jgi:pimeloyl-ACP methyl ester carboxylesterase
MFRKISRAFKAAVDPIKAAFKAPALRNEWDKIKSRIPAGDGHPVLFLPGLLGDDNTFTELRRAAEEKGYKTHGWEKGTNFGFNAKTGRHLERRLKQVYDENGGKKVTIVGHSLGGVFARELAQQYPDMVRGVITLGSPIAAADNVNTFTERNLRKIHKFFDPSAEGADKSGPLPPLTSMYSKTDAVVPWAASIMGTAPHTENIEIDGGHAEMPDNLKAAVIVLEKLAQPEGGWKPFDATAYKDIFPDKPAAKAGAPKP